MLFFLIKKIFIYYDFIFTFFYLINFFFLSAPYRISTP